MRLVYFGSGAFGLPTLQHLATHHQLLAVVTQPDKPAGRGGRVTPTPVAAWAAREAPGLAVFKPERVASIAQTVRDLPADAWVVIAYGQKLPAALLEGKPAFNLHASRLPRWRGAAPINAAILAGDTVTGNSVIALADRMDAGAVYAMDHTPIAPDETAGELHDRLAQAGPALVAGVLDEVERGTHRPWPQDEALATIAPKLRRSDGVVDFAAPAAAVSARIRGLSPWPGVTVAFRGEPLRLLKAVDAGAGSDTPPGVIADADEGLTTCGHGTRVRLISVQPAGKRAMPWRDFANGRAVRDGEQLLPAEASP